MENEQSSFLSGSGSQSRAVTTQSYALTDSWDQRAEGSIGRGPPCVSLHSLGAPLLLQSPWLSCIPEISPPTGFPVAAGSRMQLAELTWLWALQSHGPG